MLPLKALSSLYRRRLGDETSVIPRAITTTVGHRQSRRFSQPRIYCARSHHRRARMRASFRTPRNNRSFNSDAGGSSLSPSRIIRAHNARLLVIAHAFRRGAPLSLARVVSRAGFIIAAAMICRIATSTPLSPLPAAAASSAAGLCPRRASLAGAGGVYQVYELNCRFITPEGRRGSRRVPPPSLPPPPPSPLPGRSSFHFYHPLGGKNGAPSSVESDSRPFY